MKTKLQELTKEIQKQIPSILDLVFGCEYEYVIADENGDAELQLGLYGFTGMPEKNAIEKILGRKITLEDVLRVINKKKIEITIRNSFATEIHFYMGGGYKKVMAVWNLSEPLSKQTPETLSFLWDLICKKQ